MNKFKKLQSLKKERIASSGMLRRMALVRTDVSEELSASDSCHPDDGGFEFLLNVDSYKSHTA
jgi:hypothetical protein